MAGATPAQQRTVLLETLDILRSLPEGATPPQIGAKVHRLVREITGNDDPYKTIKQVSTEKALSLLPKLRTLVSTAEDPLEAAIRVSIAGNIIDLGPNPDYDLWDVVQKVQHQPLAINDLAELKQHLATVDSVLYLGDNAGETVFDKVLIENLDKPVTYVVKGGPVLNDATREDALAAGLDAVAEIIGNGARISGTVLAECSPAFKQAFNEADLILAKGMGNYETLSTVDAPIFFLLQVKCPVIGEDIGAPKGGIAIKKGSGFPES
jgi:damage-control phosphatase, subfamily I